MSTELESVERASGAAFLPFARRSLPARFSTLEREWSAVRQRCGLFDAGFRGLLRVFGSDRVTFLQGMLSNDVVRLKDGGGTYAALLTQQGKVVADLRVYVLAEEIWLDVPAARTAAVRESLERYIIADDVEFAEETCTPLIGLEGPHAAQTLTVLVAETVEGLTTYGHRAARVDGRHIRIACTSHAGESGYLLFGDAGDAAALWERCRAAGAEPVGMEALDVLRIEAGIPWYGRDLDDSTLISEVGLDSAISYQKGCYLGQEVVERVGARGQVHRKLVGLECAGDTVPAADVKLMQGGKEMGWITSAAWSPARRAAIALGYVRRECWDVGAELEIRLSGGTIQTVRVVALPFYSRA